MASSPGSIELLRATSAAVNSNSTGSLLENKIDGILSADGIDGNFQLRNISNLAAIGSLNGSFDDLTIWHSNASVVLRAQTYSVENDLIVIAGVDVTDSVALSGSPLDRIVNPNAKVIDLGSKVEVLGDVHIVAAASVTLSDQADEVLNATLGRTSICVAWWPKHPGGGQWRSTRLRTWGL